MDEMKELREAHNRIRYLEARLELVSEDGRRLTESCDGIACRDDTIKLQDDRISRLTTEGAEAKASLEFLLNLSVPGHQDWEGYMMAVRNECRRGSQVSALPPGRLRQRRN
jgi:hypothetical protein